MLLGAALCTALLLSGCGSADSEQETPLTPTSHCDYRPGKAAAKPVTAPGDNVPSGTVPVTFSTIAGDINLELDADRAPCTVNAITSLIKQGYYDDTVCHRLTTDGIYVLQCGDPTGSGSGGPGFSFKDEYPVGSGDKPKYSAGTIAMANAGPHTNGSQFFLNYEDSPLPPNYTLFGKMTPESLQVVRDIAKNGTATGAPDGPPAKDVRILKATVK